MYGFISIENTVIVVGAGRGATEGDCGMLCHICHKSFSACRARLDQLFTALTRSWWLRGSKSLSPLSSSCRHATQLSHPGGGRWHTGRRGAGQRNRSGLPRTFFSSGLELLPPLFLSRSVHYAASVPTVKWVTSCGSRLCGWGRTPPLVSGHWWSPPASRGTPPSGPGTRERCRSRSLTGSPPAGQNRHTRLMRNILWAEAFHLIACDFIWF